MTKLLYGLDKGGSYKVWKIWTVGEELFIEHGKEGGKQQLKREVVKGKNIGRANETTPAEQAVLEAESRYKKQIDKGYRETKEELTELPLLPMLAHDYLKQGHRIKYPCYASKKLDGVRCLAIRHPDRVELKSRGGKEYVVAHVQQELMHLMAEGDVWDGELYIHGKYLEEIISAVKKPNDDTPSIKFVVFDIVANDVEFDNRLSMLNTLKHRLRGYADHIETLGYFEVADEGHMKSLHKQFVAEGYEGIMIRAVDGLYEAGKRSAGLQKFKTMLDSEFQIIGVDVDVDGRAVFRVQNTFASNTFNVIGGSHEQRKVWAETQEDVLGRWVTVKYQTLYKDTQIPQFPVMVCFREGGVVDGVFTPTS